MIEGFYIEKKFYGRDERGIDYQMADAGDHPIIYRALSKALKRTERIIKNYTGIMGYTLTQPNENHPDKHEYCHYAATLTKADPQIRMEIRLYSILIK